jgi:3-oxoacyl-[acyl-carrier-protein] synthase III
VTEIADLAEDVDVLRAACARTVREMERYYRDGRHPDLSVILKACRKALQETE